MGGTTNALRAADATAAVLIAQPAGGPAAMIPGAFERRARPPAAAPRPATGVWTRPPPEDVRACDRGLLEREREGGGAPSQRAGVRRGTFLHRLWQTALHPTQRSDIWRRVRAA